MNFSMPCVPRLRRIASNLLWTPQGVIRSPLVTLGPDGRVAAVERCAEPDRLASTEFYAGMLIPDFPAAFRETFERLRADERPLPEALAGYVPAPGGIVAVVSGLDYATLRLTPRSRIRRL